MNYCCDTFEDRIKDGTIVRYPAHTRPPLKANRRAVYVMHGIDITYCPFCGVRLTGKGKGKRRKDERKTT